MDNVKRSRKAQNTRKKRQEPAVSRTIKEELIDAVIPPASSKPRATRKGRPAKVSPVYQPMSLENIDELATVWEADRRMPTAKSRRAWSLARNLCPSQVNNWWYRRKNVAKRQNIIIPEGTYDLPVGTPPLSLKLEAVDEEASVQLEDSTEDDATLVPSSDGISCYASSETAHSSPAPIDLDEDNFKSAGRRAHMDIGMLLNPVSGSVEVELTESEALAGAPTHIPAKSSNEVSCADESAAQDECPATRRTVELHEEAHPTPGSDVLFCSAKNTHCDTNYDSIDLAMTESHVQFSPSPDGPDHERFFLLMQLSAIPFLSRSADLVCSCSSSTSFAWSRYTPTLRRPLCSCRRRIHGGISFNGSLYTPDGFLIGPDPFSDYTVSSAMDMID